LTNLLLAGRHAAARRRHGGDARRRDREPAWLWWNGRTVNARAAKSAARVAAVGVASRRDAVLLEQRWVEVSTRGRSMTFWPVTGRQRSGTRPRVLLAGGLRLGAADV